MCLSFTLEADTLELKQLFKKKDTVEGLVKEAGFSHNSTSIAIYECFRFFEKYFENFEAKKETQKIVVEEDIYNHPVIKIYLSLTAVQIEEVQMAINIMKECIRPENDAKKDHTYFVLDTLLDFVLENRMKFNDFIKSNFSPSKVHIVHGVAIELIPRLLYLAMYLLLWGVNSISAPCM